MQEKNENYILEEDDEMLSVFQDGIPRKKKLNTLLGIHQNDEEDECNDERNSSADFAKIDMRVNAQKKFDIKQLKIEIWKIITLKGIPSLNYRKNQSRMDEKKDFSFTDLMVTFGN